MPGESCSTLEVPVQSIRDVLHDDVGGAVFDLEVMDAGDVGVVKTSGQPGFALEGVQVLGIVGESGCGKSTFLRCLNRMNDLIPSVHIEGLVEMDGQDVNAGKMDEVALRRRVGMVFQKPNPFPKSIYENIAYAPRMHDLVSRKADQDELVEKALRDAGLWNEVKDKLQEPGTSLSGGQQQRLCIARAIAVQPDVILMDEPTSALDPISTLAIEDLINELKNDYLIVIVTHNMQQAARVSDFTGFFNIEGTGKPGKLVELAQGHRGKG